VTAHIHSTQAAPLIGPPQAAMVAALPVDNPLRRWNIDIPVRRGAERGRHALFLIKEEEFYGGWK
jgi:hypothetical protein